MFFVDLVSKHGSPTNNWGGVILSNYHYYNFTNNFTSRAIVHCGEGTFKRILIKDKVIYPTSYDGKQRKREYMRHSIMGND